MSNGIDDILTKILEGDDMPSRVSNQLLLGAIIETRSQLIDRHDQLAAQVKDLDIRLEVVEVADRLQAETPSLLWLIRYRPAVVLKCVLVLLSLIGVSQAPELVTLLINLFGG